MLNYADTIGEYTLHRRPASRSRQSKTGYGKRMVTDIKLKFANESRERRVYCCRYSNAGTFYILIKGSPVYLKTHFQEDILD